MLRRPLEIRWLHETCGDKPEDTNLEKLMGHSQNIENQLSIVITEPLKV